MEAKHGHPRGKWRRELGANENGGGPWAEAPSGGGGRKISINKKKKEKGSKTEEENGAP